MTLIGNAYRWIFSKISTRPTNFGWVIEDQLAGSGLPITHDQFRWLLDHNIKSVVTVREIPLPTEWINTLPEAKTYDDYNFNCKINYLHLPVEDYKAPTLEQLRSAISFIENEIILNRGGVLVHCAAGKGRTGTILAAYLLKTENLTVDDTIKKLRSIRPGSVQTEVQEKILFEYAYCLKNKI